MQAPVRLTSRMGAASAAFSVLELLWVGMGMVPSPFSGLVLVLVVLSPPIAIVCGHLARAGIRRSAGRMDGDHLAVIGLCLGYMELAGIIVFLACLGTMSALFSNGTWKG